MKRVKQVEVFKFSELSEDIQKKIIRGNIELFDYSWVTQDFIDSIKRFSKFFGLDFDYRLGYDRGTYCKFMHQFEGLTREFFEDYRTSLSWWREEKQGKCSFSGIYTDGFFADEVVENWENDFQDFLVSLGKKIDFECTKEMEYRLSEEAMREEIIALDEDFDYKGRYIA